MHRRLTLLTPHLPAALLLLYSGWAGTFSGGARGEWALAGHLALLLFVGALGDLRPDPLRLGGGRWLLWALVISVLASHLASPVMRAGRLGVLLLPVFVLMPSAVARCWSSEPARRAGLRSVSLVVGGVAMWSLVGWWRLETLGASLPLGHHNLLAAWLLVLLPLAAVPWREGGVGRMIAALAGVAGLVALVGTRSLAAALAVGLVALVLMARRRLGAWGLMVVAAPLLVTQLPRLSAVLGGDDTSAAARWSYLRAGWQALLERPVLGWGPGAGRWTMAEHLRPIPGTHVPDQVVADPHSLPVLIGYELGLSGLLLISGLVLAFVRRRPEGVVDPALRGVALWGLGALVLMSFAGRPLAASAIPLAMMIGIGAILAAEAPPARGVGMPRRAPRVVARLLAMAAWAWCVVPLDLAHLAYDRALRADSDDPRARHLRRAVELDPAFPLYRARLAWLEAGGEQMPGAEAARRAHAAAEDARGVAPLWLVAGMLGQEAGASWSREALLRACQLSPLGVIAPYRLTFESSSAADRVRWTGRALLAEPLVLAAVAWSDREPVLRAAVDEVGRLDGVDADWHAWLEQVLEVRLNNTGQGESRRSRLLALGMDGELATSASLYVFRRQPWPVDLARIELDESMLESIAPGASGLPQAAIFGGELCGFWDASEP